jgi:hypothetical protein
VGSYRLVVNARRSGAEAKKKKALMGRILARGLRQLRKCA